jgi:hypothetical protein
MDNSTTSQSQMNLLTHKRMKVAIFSRSGSKLQFIYAGHLEKIPFVDVTLINLKINLRTKIKIAKRIMTKIGPISFLFFLLNKKIETKLMNRLLTSINSMDSIHFNEKDSNLCSYLNNQNFDLICVAQSGVISKEVLNSTNGLWVNIHPAKLPEFRGYAEPASVIAEQRLDCLGATIHKVRSGIDDGEIITWIPIVKNDYKSTNQLLLEARIIGIAKLTELIGKGQIFDLANKSLPQANEQIGYSQILNWKRRLMIDLSVYMRRFKRFIYGSQKFS